MRLTNKIHTVVLCIYLLMFLCSTALCSTPATDSIAAKPTAVQATNSTTGAIIPSTPPSVTIEHLLVKALYPRSNYYELSVDGTGFSKMVYDSLCLQISNKKTSCRTVIQWRTPSAKDSLDSTTVFAKILSDRRILIFNIPKYFAGQNTLELSYGPRTNEKATILFSRISETGIKLVSIGVTLALCLILMVVFSRYRSSSGNYPFYKSMIIDEETDTYSLSKLQFVIWTMVALTTYIYLFVAKNFVQGTLSFVDIPSGLPGIILISAFTSATAKGIATYKGNKGAGDITPRISDLITSGGLIAPERLQFFLWTIVGVLGFVTIVFTQDPGNIQDLPTIPEGFLELMGISSLGYIGGKIARRAGPNIENLAVTYKVPNQLSMTLSGRNLSKDATFRIDKGKPLFDGDGKLSVVKDGTEVAFNEQGMGTKLLLSITLSDDIKKYADAAKHIFTVINPDGQKAEVEYVIEPTPPPAPVVPIAGGAQK